MHFFFHPIIYSEKTISSGAVTFCSSILYHFFCNFLHKTVYFIAFLAVIFIYLFFKIQSRYRHKYYLVGICVLFFRLFVCFILKTFQYFVWKLGILYDDNKKKQQKIEQTDCYSFYKCWNICYCWYSHLIVFFYFVYTNYLNAIHLFALLWNFYYMLFPWFYWIGI